MHIETPPLLGALPEHHTAHRPHSLTALRSTRGERKGGVSSGDGKKGQGIQNGRGPAGSAAEETAKGNQPNFAARCLYPDKAYFGHPLKTKTTLTDAWGIRN